MFGVLRKDPELLAERLRRGAGDQDRLSRPLFALFFLAHWILAGLDVGRFRWTGNLPVALQVAAFIALAIGLAGWLWPMSVNRFFSAQVRLQSERGHTVIDRGPYRFVRHPGYAAFLLILFSSPLALGSFVSGIPAFMMAVVLICRTAFEDRFLHANLPGYREYAARVRYRLLPGIW
jgi:protein-S-isoprenylcysteine O-methyltransferase Ste14